MNFIIFSAQYLPTVGGVERYTNSLAKQLINNGHSVTVVTSSLENQPTIETDFDNIHIYRIPVKWIMNNRFSIPIPNKTFKQINNSLKSEKFDFAIIQTKFYLNSAWASKFCKKNNIPAIVIEHGTAHLMRNGIVGFIGSTYEHICAKYIYHNCKNFYGVSLACCQWLSHFGIKAKGCLYNAVDPKTIYDISLTGENSLKEKVNFNDKTTICFAGRFIKEKGVVNLANAFAEFNKTYPNTQLIMAGNGALWQQIKDMNIPNLILTGTLSYAESLALLKNSDIFCLPTFSEGFSTSVLEASALKCFIITTATGGSPQLVKDKNHGIIIPSMESSDILSALTQIINNKEYVQQCAENAYINLINNFTWEKVSQNFLEICKNQKESI